MNLGSSGCRYYLTSLSCAVSFLTSAQELLRGYCNTADQLKDAVTNASNQQILNLALGRENEELKSKFEELQRSVVSGVMHE